MNVLLGYGFVEFLAEEDADYSIKIMNMIKLYGKPIRVNKASAHQKNLDVGANIFIGNLDPEVDEKLLYDTFSAFGVILTTPKIQRDPETGNSKGFAFINYASFEAADAAIEAMNGQYLCNRYDDYINSCINCIKRKSAFKLTRFFWSCRGRPYLNSIAIYD